MPRPPGDPVFPEDLVDEYQPVRLLGAGGMGEVWLTQDRALSRPVALKVARVGLSGDTERRYLREAAALAQVKHANVVTVFSSGTCSRGPYLVMEYVEGNRLSSRAPTEAVIEPLLQAASGLEALHAEGLVHRDFKPANIMIPPGGEAVLIDFGLVLDADLTRLTITDAVPGTIGYMAPELLAYEVATPATDWFAFGVSHFWLRERRLPYEQDQLMALSAGRSVPPPEFRRIAADSPEAAAILACLDPDPERRPDGVRALRRILRGKAGPRRRRRRRRGFLARWNPNVAGVAAGLLAALLLFPPGNTGPPPVPPPQATAPGSSSTEGPFDDAFPDRLRRERISRQGLLEEVVRNPLRWRTAIPELEEIGGFYRWLAAGGDPREISPVLLRRLELVEREYRELGMPPTLFPYLHLRPARSPMEVPPELGGGDRTYGGWLGTALEEFRKARQLWYALDGDANAAIRNQDTTRLPPEMLEVLLGDRKAILRELFRSSTSLKSMVKFRWTMSGHRAALQRWLAEPASHLQASLFAFGRSFRLEPETRDEAAVMAFHAVGDLDVLYASHLCGMDPEWLMGGLTLEPYGQAVACVLAERMRSVLSAGGSPGGDELWVTIEKHAVRSMDTSKLPEDRQPFNMAWGELTALLARRRVDVVALRRAFLKFLPRARTQGLGDLTFFYRKVLDRFLREDHPLANRKGFLDELERLVEEEPPGLDSRLRELYPEWRTQRSP